MQVGGEARYRGECKVAVIIMLLGMYSAECG